MAHREGKLRPADRRAGATKRSQAKMSPIDQIMERRSSYCEHWVSGDGNPAPYLSVPRDMRMVPSTTRPVLRNCPRRSGSRTIPATKTESWRIAMAIFDETYRVVAVESQRLTIQGIFSGEIMTIVNTAPETPLTQEDYPLGQLIALTDPSAAPQN